jgi:hypothetical protein
MAKTPRATAKGGGFSCGGDDRSAEKWRLSHHLDTKTAGFFCVRLQNALKHPLGEQKKCKRMGPISRFGKEAMSFDIQIPAEFTAISRTGESTIPAKDVGWYA